MTRRWRRWTPWSQAQPGNAAPQQSRRHQKQAGPAEEALADFDRALALDASNADALNNRGLILHSLRRYERRWPVSMPCWR